MMQRSWMAMVLVAACGQHKEPVTLALPEPLSRALVAGTVTAMRAQLVLSAGGEVAFTSFGTASADGFVLAFSGVKAGTYDVRVRISADTARVSDIPLLDFHQADVPINEGPGNSITAGSWEQPSGVDIDADGDGLSNFAEVFYGFDPGEAFSPVPGLENETSSVLGFAGRDQQGLLYITSTRVQPLPDQRRFELTGGIARNLTQPQTSLPLPLSPTFNGTCPQGSTTWQSISASPYQLLVGGTGGCLLLQEGGSLAAWPTIVGSECSSTCNASNRYTDDWVEATAGRARSLVVGSGSDVRYYEQPSVVDGFLTFKPTEQSAGVASSTILPVVLYDCSAGTAGQLMASVQDNWIGVYDVPPQGSCSAVIDADANAEAVAYDSAAGACTVAVVYRDTSGTRYLRRISMPNRPEQPSGVDCTNFDAGFTLHERLALPSSLAQVTALHYGLTSLVVDAQGEPALTLLLGDAEGHVYRRERVGDFDATDNGWVLAGTIPDGSTVKRLATDSTPPASAPAGMLYPIFAWTDSGIYRAP